MIKGGARFRKKPRKPGRNNKAKLMNTRGGVVPKPKVRKR